MTSLKIENLPKLPLQDTYVTTDKLDWEYHGTKLSELTQAEADFYVTRAATHSVSVPELIYWCEKKLPEGATTFSILFCNTEPLSREEIDKIRSRIKETHARYQNSLEKEDLHWAVRKMTVYNHCVIDHTFRHGEMRQVAKDMTIFKVVFERPGLVDI